MRNYESLVDWTEFGIVAGYLKNPQSPISLLLHVKDEASLAKLAEELERSPEVNSLQPDDLGKVLDPLLRDGSVKVSLRETASVSDSKSVVEPASIPRHSPCKVIYLPPFYLVHTPGLFEGKLLRSQELTQTEARQATPMLEQSIELDLDHDR